jgi:hypothetical protein
LGLAFGAGLAATGAAALAEGFAGEDFLGFAAVFRAVDFFAAALTDLGADFLTAGLTVERAGAAVDRAFFAGAGRPALRRSFAMFLLLWRS